MATTFHIQILSPELVNIDKLEFLEQRRQFHDFQASHIDKVPEHVDEKAKQFAQSIFIANFLSSANPPQVGVAYNTTFFDRTTNTLMRPSLLECPHSGLQRRSTAGVSQALNIAFPKDFGEMGSINVRLVVAEACVHMERSIALLRLIAKL